MLVAGLEEKGFVERVLDPQDGRARIIRFTPAGRAAVRRAQRIVLRVEREWEEHLGPGWRLPSGKGSPGSASSPIPTGEPPPVEHAVLP